MSVLCCYVLVKALRWADPPSKESSRISKYSYERYEVFTAAKIEVEVSWTVTPYNVVVG